MKIVKEIKFYKRDLNFLGPDGFECVEIEGSFWDLFPWIKLTWQREDEIATQNYRPKKLKDLLTGQKYGIIGIKKTVFGEPVLILEIPCDNL